MSNKDASNALLKGIQFLVKQELKNAPIDKTLTGIIKNVKEDNLYDVIIDGYLYTNIPSIFTGLTNNNTVKIKVPQGQYSQMYIEGKYNITIQNGGTSTGVTSVNGKTGDIIIQEDKTYVHNQLEASDTWVINHNLNKFPNVTIVDSENNMVMGEVQYNSENQITISFIGSFLGKAFLN